MILPNYEAFYFKKLKIENSTYYSNLLKILENSPEIIVKAQKFALEKHRNQKRKDGVVLFIEHLVEVVNRLKNLGIFNPNVLCAAWLHDTIEHTDTTFDEINEIFGNTIAVLVLSLTKDMNLPKKERELQYVKQLREASWEAKIIKFCDISTNLKDISNSPMSKNKKNKNVKKLFHYLRIIKKDLAENNSSYLKIQEFIEGINVIGAKYRQKPIFI